MKIVQQLKGIYRKVRGIRPVQKLNMDAERRFVFIHIPKNAGTSISKSLGFDKTYHTKIAQVQQMLPKEQYEALFKFGIVRHPYDRFLSLYHYATANESFYHSALQPDQARHGKHPNYEGLKEKSLQDCARMLIADQLIIPNAYYIWAPQSEWLLDEDGKMGLDFMGRFEQLSDDFQHILQKLQRPPIQLPNYNASSNRGEHRQLDATTKSILQEYYRTDFDLLDYTP
ncbi:MAG: sulfotransferase family 2 domain-containing protein [Bacteroidota bacterium]